MIEPIRGKVARVLNKYEIAITVGTVDGVNVGMYFDVMDAYEQDIEDPDTGEILGSIERSKIRVKIIYAQEKLSIAAAHPYLSAREMSSGRIRSSGTLGPFARSLMPPAWVIKYDTGEQKQTGKTKDSLKEEYSYANTGDPVVQVLEEDEAEQENTNGK